MVSAIYSYGFETSRDRIVGCFFAWWIHVLCRIEVEAFIRRSPGHISLRIKMSWLIYRNAPNFNITQISKGTHNFPNINCKIRILLTFIFVIYDIFELWPHEPYWDGPKKPRSDATWRHLNFNHNLVASEQKNQNSIPMCYILQNCEVFWYKSCHFPKSLHAYELWTKIYHFILYNAYRPLCKC